mmetsp:Transcript_5022/g.7079  ORF Transcript_5022/g.7079 Transcript_5022/m.7079 type:complete len:164 (+) Transcript_5022:144-635(+)
MFKCNGASRRSRLAQLDEDLSVTTKQDGETLDEDDDIHYFDDDSDLDDDEELYSTFRTYTVLERPHGQSYRQHEMRSQQHHHEVGIGHASSYEEYSSRLTRYREWQLERNRLLGRSSIDLYYDLGNNSTIAGRERRNKRRFRLKTPRLLKMIFLTNRISFQLV